MGNRVQLVGSLVLLVIAPAPPIWAEEGAIELSQAGALANGGFPIGLNAPGRYVLTSNLSPVGTGAIEIQADGVMLDFRGFSLLGAASAGATGIEITGQHATLSNGRIDGFGIGLETSDDGVRLERMTFSNNGSEGAILGGAGLVVDSIFAGNGEWGLSATATTGYSRCVFANNGGRDVQGAFALGESLCDGLLCRTTNVRRFYRTRTFHRGNEVAGSAACAPGFHFASITEMLPPAALAYDPTLGYVSPGSAGEGPPHLDGWIDGLGPDCNGWTDGTSGMVGGRLYFALPASQSLPATAISPLGTNSGSCSSQLQVWCVEDVR